MRPRRQTPTPEPGAQYLSVPLVLIDEPPAPIRSAIDPDGLQDLAQSIRAVGLIHPLIVSPANGRYTIQAGHRRYLAARLVPLAQVPCLVLPLAQATAEAVLVHENAHREDVNAADEGDWFSRLLESQCAGDVDRLVELVRESRAYVEERLLLSSGDANVCAAVRSGEISFAVGRELNKYADQPLRRMRLQAAVEGGATARLVRDWRTKDRLLDEACAAQGAPAPGPDPAAAPAGQDLMLCFVCASGEDKYDMELLWIHRSCHRMLSRRLEGDRGQS